MKRIIFVLWKKESSYQKIPPTLFFLPWNPFSSDELVIKGIVDNLNSVLSSLGRASYFDLLIAFPRDEEYVFIHRAYSCTPVENTPHITIPENCSLLTSQSLLIVWTATSTQPILPHGSLSYAFAMPLY